MSEAAVAFLKTRCTRYC